MTPELPVAYHADKARANAVAVSNLLLSSTGKCSNVLYLTSGELVTTVYFPSGLVTSANSVRDVFGIVSKPKVCRINARRVVTAGAVVQDVQTVWNRPEVQNPTGTVSADMCLTVPARRYLSVAPLINLRRPEPAAVSDAHLGPEASREGYRESLAEQVVSRHFNPFFKHSYCGDSDLFTKQSGSLLPKNGKTQEALWA